MHALTLHRCWQRLEQPYDALQEAWPALLYTDRDVLRSKDEKGGDCGNRQLLVMNSSKTVDIGEPHAEELVGPAVALEDMEREYRVVVDTIDHHLH